MDAVVKCLAEVNVNVFKKNWNAAGYVPALDNALINSTSAACRLGNQEQTIVSI